MSKRTIQIGIAMALFLILCIAIICKGYTSIPSGHVGFSVIFGKVNEKVLPNGLAIRYPFIEDIAIVSLQQQKEETYLALFSSDLQVVQMRIFTLYRRPENQAYKLFVEYPERDVWTHFHVLIEPRILEHIKVIASEYSAEQINKQREKIKTLLLEKIRNTMGDLLIIDDVSITYLSLSNELEKSIEQKMIMQQEALKKGFEVERAKREAEMIVVKAEAESKALALTGEALKGNPSILYLEVIRRWNGGFPTTLVVGNTPSTFLPLMPFNQDVKK